jgi:exodeoxyribonuclease III
MIRIASWNVNGIRATIKKGFWDSIGIIQPDIIGIQETKSDETIMASGVADHHEFDIKYHSCSMKKGYSGVATFSRLLPDEILLTSSSIGLGVSVFDIEGRIVTTKYTIKNPKTDIKNFTLINGYYPQGGRDGRIPYKIEFYKEVASYAKKLRDAGEYVILIGDLNTTVGDIDLARPKENRNTTGCLPEEREALDWLLKDGFTDSFRYMYPEKPEMYSYWDQITRARERNVGWRIDYVILDDRLLPFLKQAYIWSEILGSDHCPVGVDLDL